MRYMVLKNPEGKVSFQFAGEFPVWLSLWVSDKH